MGLLKACGFAALLFQSACASGEVDYTPNGNSSLLSEDYLGLCEVFAVVESETLINTCVSAPAVLVVGCSTINITEPTCITTIVTVSSTITEDVGNVDVQTNVSPQGIVAAPAEMTQIVEAVPYAPPSP